MIRDWYNNTLNSYTFGRPLASSQVPVKDETPKAHLIAILGRINIDEHFGIFV